MTNHLLWYPSEPTLNAAIAAAVARARAKGWQPGSIIFRTGEKPAGVTLPAGVEIGENLTVTPGHFQVWPKGE